MKIKTGTEITVRIVGLSNYLESDNPVNPNDCKEKWVSVESLIETLKPFADEYMNVQTVINELNGINKNETSI